MKKYLFVLLAVSLCGCVPDELETLKKAFRAEDDELKKGLDKAMTTVEICGSAGEHWQVAEKQLLRTLDWKLRQTKDAAERIAMLKVLHELGNEIRGIMEESYEGTGTIEPVNRSFRAALLLNRQQMIWMLNKEEKARWDRVANASGMIGGKKITLKNGRAEFVTKMYDENTKLEIMLSPGDISTRDGRDFVRIKTDIPKANNDDFESIYRCEVKDGIIISAVVEKKAE